MTDNTRRVSVPAHAFNACYLPYLTAQQRYQIFFGGAGSGKSVFVATRCMLDALCGRSTLVVREVARTLRQSSFAEIEKAIARFGVQQHFKVRSSEMTITCLLSGAQILFAGLDDVEKVKSITPQHGVLTDIWIEEATQTGHSDIKQLEKRLRGISRHKKRLTMTFNPVSRGHWLYERFFTGFGDDQTLLDTPDLLILRTTYRDNAFLTAEDCRAMEAEQHQYYRQVYTLGQWGEVGETILTGWRAEDLAPQLAAADCLRCGLDFGFAQDPCAAVLVQYDRTRKRILVLKEFYARGLTNDVLAQRMSAFALGVAVICDSAEPKSIAELRRMGIPAFPARKGPDSVLHGIQWLQQHDIIVDVRCTHIQKELMQYRWRKDTNGDPMPVPEPGNDHLLDALRYALEGDRIASFAAAQRR